MLNGLELRKMKYKTGMVLIDKSTGQRIELTGKHNGNGHWNSKKLDSSTRKVHRIHEGTLDKYYTLDTNNG